MEQLCHLIVIIIVHREGEVDGIHYHFSELEAMEKAVARGEFLEYAKVHGNFYGTSSSAVEKVRDRVCVRVCV